MSAARLAGIPIVMLLSSALAGQAPQIGHLEIRVTDPTGTPIPSAEIWIDQPRSQGQTPSKSNDDGRIFVDLPAGNHTVLIVSPGFKHQTMKIAIRAGNNRPITATLQLGGYYGPTLIETMANNLPLYRPEPDSISTQPLETIPLPPISIRRHRR